VLQHHIGAQYSARANARARQDVGALIKAPHDYLAFSMDVALHFLNEA